MVTALNEAADFERGVQAGTDDFLTKPVNKTELLCRIRSILRVRHLKSQLDRTLAYVAEYVDRQPGIDDRAMTGSRPPRIHARRVILKPRRARPFFARHPWVFESSIERVDGQPAAGDEVDVVSHEGQFIARGLFNPASTIRVRLYRWDPGPLDESFWSGLIAAAARLRHQVLGLGGEQSAYRLVSSEGDGLSGLTVDRYDRWLVVQFTSLALYDRRELILRLLDGSHGCPRDAILRTERGIAQKEGLPAGQETHRRLDCRTRPVAIIENGLTYRVDLRDGPEDRLLPRPAAQSPGRRGLLPRPASPRPLLLHRRLFLERRSATAHRAHSGSTARRVRSSWLASTPRSTGSTGAQFEEGDVFDVLERLRTRRKALRRGHLRPAQVRQGKPATSRGRSRVT